MGEEGRNILGVSAEECQTADVAVVLSSDEKAGNRAAGLLQELQETEAARRAVRGEEICDRLCQLVSEDESCGDASSFAPVGIEAHWSGDAHRELDAQNRGIWWIGLELCDYGKGDRRLPWGRPPRRFRAK